MLSPSIQASDKTTRGFVVGRRSFAEFHSTLNNAKMVSFAMKADQRTVRFLRGRTAISAAQRRRQQLAAISFVFASLLVQRTQSCARSSNLIATHFTHMTGGSQTVPVESNSCVIAFVARSADRFTASKDPAQCRRTRRASVGDSSRMSTRIHFSHSSRM